MSPFQIHPSPARPINMVTTILVLTSMKHITLQGSPILTEGICDVPMDDLELLSFGDLLEPTFGDRTYTMGEAYDYFQEAIDILQNGEYQFSFSRPLNLRGEELGLETEEGGFGGEEGVDVFGIDIPGKFYQQVCREISDVRFL